MSRRKSCRNSSPRRSGAPIPRPLQQWMKRLNQIADVPANRKPTVLAQRAKAEKLIFGDDRWRATMAQAIAAADRSSAFVRRDIGVPLAGGPGPDRKRPSDAGLRTRGPIHRR